MLVQYPKRMLIKIPDNVKDEDAVLFDIFSTAYHGFRRSNFRAGMNAVVVGAGAIGLSMIQILKALRCRSRHCGKPRPQKAPNGPSEFGADLALSPNEEADISKKIKSVYGGRRGHNIRMRGKSGGCGLIGQHGDARGEVILVGTNPEPLSTR